MAPDDLARLYADLRRDEGERASPYTDTAGKLTIGVGHNLTDVPLTGRAMQVILEDDVAAAMASADRVFPWWRAKSPDWQRGFLNLVFNLGPERLLGFHDFLAAYRQGDGAEAADALLDSRWAHQVGIRALRLETLFRTTAPI
jgi:lysozyme